MKIAALQTDIAWENPAKNFAHLRPKIAEAAACGARLVVLPEMYACGFSMQTQAIREPQGGPSTVFLQEMARTHNLWICGSLPEEVDGAEHPANTLVLSNPTGELTRYRKIHPFTFAREHEHYTAGDRHCTVEIEGLRCTLFVCYDLRFADEFWCTANDTDAYLVVANWPQKRRVHWQVLARARAIENQAYVVAVNRVGEGNGLAYSGDSCIYDPLGEPLVTAAMGETMLLADLEPDVVKTAREKFPVLADRRAKVFV